MILGTDSSYCNTIEHTGSSPELRKAVMPSLINVWNFDINMESN